MLTSIGLDAQTIGRGMNRPGKSQSPAAATWSAAVRMTGAKSGVLDLTLVPAKGWHIYGPEVGENGPRPMSINLSKSTGIKLKGNLTFSVAPVKKHDDMFGIDVTYWETKVVISQRFEVTDRKAAKLIGTVSYQGCNESTCTPPQKYEINLAIPTK